MKIHCRRPRFFRMISLLAAGLLPASGDEVSTTPPPVYQEMIRPLMTPLEVVAGRKDPHAGKAEPGTVRLAEQITRVEEDGTYLRAVHYIYQPYSDKGAEAVANDRYRFYSRQESVHLALARTILADGTEKALGPNAAFLQKGHRGSGSTYDDAQDLVIVFPDVKPGVLCEAIVVYERKEPAVKGGYGELIDWSANWPVGENRQVLDLPAAWKPRLKMANLGKRGTPMSEIRAPEGRVRLEWKRESVECSPYEPNAAPVAQEGPATWLSTFASWDEMAAWYQGLLAERRELDDELKAKVDEWTTKAKTPREILGILHRRVANDVRYEGLEFGNSGLQPYPCGTVWKNQYGDCKDKANLLVAMLRHKGISAKLVLVNTRHAGVVTKEIPDYRHFNHAIAVAELPAADGSMERIFCDATINHGRPGLLSPSAADREVLAIDEGKALWLKTPASDAGEDSYSFDLELTPEGRLAGWLTITSQGLYGVRLADTYAGVDRDTARQRLSDRVSDFIAGAEVVDFELPAAEETVNETVVKVYLTGPARQMDHDGRLNLPFPSAPELFNDYGNGKARRTPFFQWRDRIRVGAAIRLPEGWQPESLPQPLKLDTPAYLVRASWQSDGGFCRAALLLDCRESVIPADAVAVLVQANRALDSWLKIALLLKKGGAKLPPEATPAEDPALPLMPTGEGQLKLVDRLFPRGSDATRRRAALEKVIRFFPNDSETVFGARVEMAYLHVSGKDFNAAREAFAELVSRRPDGVDAETFAYPRYLLAMAMQKTNQEDAGLVILRELAADVSLSEFRRGWSATLAGKWLAKRRPVAGEALTLLKQAAAIDEEFRDSALVALVPAMVSGGEGEELVKLLAEGQELDSFKDGGAAVLTQVTDAAKSGGEGTSAAEMLPWLVKARDHAGDEDRKNLLVGMCAALEGWLARDDAYAAVRSGLIEAIGKLSPQYLEGKDPDDTAPKVEAALAGLYGKDREAWMKLAAGYFRKFEPTPEFARIVWQFLGYLQKIEGASAVADDKSLFAAAAEAACKLPKGDDYNWECQFIKAWWLRDHGKVQDAEAVYRAMLDEPGFPDDFNHSAWHGLGETLELQARWKEAATCYVKFKDERHQHLTVTKSLLRAGLLLARIGEEQDALATWKLLADVPETIYAESPLAAAIKEAIVLAADEKATIAQWQRMDGWWKKQFLPYFKSLAIGSINDPPPYLADQGDALNLRCRKAVAAKDMAVVAKDLASLAESVRWLPCQILSLQQMVMIYVRPLHPGSEKLDPRLLEEVAAAVRVSAPLTAEYCLRLYAGTAFDRGEPELTLTLLDGQSDEAPGRSAEHRERCGYIFALAAIATDRKVEQAIAYSAEVQKQGPAFVGAGAWACLHADLLVKAGKPAGAVAFLKAKAAEPNIKGAPETLTPITEKLATLSKQSGRAEALVSSVRVFLEKHRPIWYAHVGPSDLTDARVGNPDKVLAGDISRFHEAELFRLRMLVALAPEPSIETREQAFSDAILTAGKWRRTWPEAVAVWSHVLDDGALSLEMRLPMMWKAANQLAEEGQVESIAELRGKPMFNDFNENYEKRYFPMIESFGKARKEGPAEARAALVRLGERELDAREFELSSIHYACLLGWGDLEGAEVARTALKSWKLAPDAMPGRNDQRLTWMRQASGAKELLAFDELMHTTFKETIKTTADKAPAGWQQRIDIQELADLTNDQAAAVRAAIVASGFRTNLADSRKWFSKEGFWLFPKGVADRAKVCGIIPLLLAIKNDFVVSLLLAGVLTEVKGLPDGGWKDLDEVLKRDPQAGKRPTVDAMLEFWRFFRSYKPGDPVDVSDLIRISKQMGVMASLGFATTIECLIVNGDTKGLETVIDATDSKNFTATSGLGNYIDALRLLERKDELELVMENAERAICEEMMTAWVEGSPASIRRASDLAIECGLTKLLPEAWRKDMPKVSGDKLTAGLVRARMAQLEGDWETMKDSLTKVETEADDDAAWHWLMGRALVGLGKPELARKHLDKVIQQGMLEGSHIRQAWKLRNTLEEH